MVAALRWLVTELHGPYDPSNTGEYPTTQSLDYALNGVVVHSGGSVDSGHYYAFIKVLHNHTCICQPCWSTHLLLHCNRALMAPGTA